MSDDPVVTLTALAAYWREAFYSHRDTAAKALADHVDGVIARHWPKKQRVFINGEYECDMDGEDYPCVEVRELLAVAQALGVLSR